MSRRQAQAMIIGCLGQRGNGQVYYFGGYFLHELVRNSWQTNLCAGGLSKDALHL